jgi:hypothetical protein
MKELYYFLKQELVSVVLGLVSFIPLFFIGSLLDIILTHFYAHVENGKAVLPTISQWVYENMAGHRFLPQEIMVCIWIFMAMLFILNAFFSKDQQQFRMRFIYSFLFTWVMAMTVTTLIVFACISPFDLLFSRIEENALFDSVIHIIFLLEMIVVILIPAGLIVMRRIGKGWQKTELKK